MNKNQKIVLAIFVPIIIFFIALTIANDIGYTVKTRAVSENSYLSKYKSKTYHEDNPFDWGRTWGVWLIYSVFCCLFEFLLFRDKKREIKRI